jgi:mono/diheme cytochrome c family protein
MVRGGALVVILIGVVVGCASLDSQRYPASLKYPLRKDLLVKEVPTVPPGWHPTSPGQLEQAIVKASKEAGAKMFDPAKLSSADRRELNDALEATFGTPARPKVDIQNEAVNDLKLDDVTLRRGSMHYRRHCLHCHGLAGDGRGPTGPWVNPHPRDYRSGKFKFISTNPDLSGTKPRQADLLRTLRQGIDSTSMPSFGLLPDNTLEELASYVTHLSLRGETEFDTMVTLIGGGKTALEDGSIEKHVASRASTFLDQWNEANKSINKPPDYKPLEDAALKASIGRGYKLFLGTAGCIGCHLDYGRQAPYRYDHWGTLVRPANLTVSTYRGGRRPIDLYWRITKGIGPSDMAGQGNPVKKVKPGVQSLNDQGMWDLVNFVQALPFSGMLPEDVRKAVYGERGSSAKGREQASR